MPRSLQQQQAAVEEAAVWRKKSVAVRKAAANATGTTADCHARCKCGGVNVFCGGHNDAAIKAAYALSCTDWEKLLQRCKEHKTLPHQLQALLPLAARDLPYFRTIDYANVLVAQASAHECDDALHVALFVLDCAKRGATVFNDTDGVLTAIACCSQMRSVGLLEQKGEAPRGLVVAFETRTLAHCVRDRLQKHCLNPKGPKLTITYKGFAKRAPPPRALPTTVPKCARRPMLVDRADAHQMVVRGARAVLVRSRFAELREREAPVRKRDDHLAGRA